MRLCWFYVSLHWHQSMQLRKLWMLMLWWWLHCVRSNTCRFQLRLQCSLFWINGTIRSYGPGSTWRLSYFVSLWIDNIDATLLSLERVLIDEFAKLLSGPSLLWQVYFSFKRLWFFCFKKIPRIHSISVNSVHLKCLAEFPFCGLGNRWGMF